MANLKNITDVPMAESADGLNLIVNDNGAAKQMPANKLSSCVVTFSRNGEESWVADKTFNEIKEAVESGISVWGRYSSKIYALESTGGGEGFGFIDFERLFNNCELFWLWEDNSVTRDIRAVQLASLRFTGAVKTVYNGRQSVTVNIPTEEWDLDLTCDITWNTETSTENEPVFTAAEGYSYDAFVAKVESGDIPKIKFRFNSTDSSGVTFSLMNRHCNIMAQNGMYALFVLTPNMPLIIVLNEDGTFTMGD